VQLLASQYLVQLRASLYSSGHLCAAQGISVQLRASLYSSGDYRCVVSNSAGSEISQAVSLTVGKLAYYLSFGPANCRQHCDTALSY